MAEIKNKHNASFGILRANPRISGNVKITVDSTENLWLNSIDSNEQLSKSVYKGFKISSNSDYAQDLYRFFDRGKTPEEFVFGVKGENSQVETFVSDYSDQYDGFYSCGVSPLISDVYSEEFSYFAPFWLGRKIPKYFVVYRIDDPIDFSYINPVTSLEVGKTYKVLGDSASYTITTAGKNYTNGSIFTAENTVFSANGAGKVVSLDPNYNYSLIGDPQKHFAEKILPKTSIVASYDMTENSEIGKYLRKIQNNPNYQQSLINARFEENLMTYFNGINYNSGVYDTKGEYLSDFYLQPTTQIEFEEFMTNGFNRNGIVSYKYLNLEFLFNDPEAPLYSINRYMGVFVDEVPTGSFQLDGLDFFNKGYLAGNMPESKSKDFISSTMEYSFFQENPKGVRLFMDEDSKFGYIPSSDDVNTENRFYYIKDNTGKLYSYRNLLGYSENDDPAYKWETNEENKNQLVVSNKVLDVSKFSGFNKNTTKQISGTLADQKGNPYAILKIGGEFLIGESIVIYHPLGDRLHNGKKCNILITSNMSTVVDSWGEGSYYSLGEGLYFHPYGSNENIAKGIVGLINSVQYRGFTAYHFGDEVVIRCHGTGYIYNKSFAIDCFDDLPTSSRLDRMGVLSVNGIDALDFRYEQYFIGGSNHSNNRIKIKLEDSNKIIPGKSMVRTNNGISIIDGVYAYVDEVDETTRNASLKDYKTHAIISYKDYTKNVLIGYLGKIIIEEIYSNETGVLSLYPVKDMDYDFWYSEYKHTHTEEYYRYLDVRPDGISKIIQGQTYCVSAGCVILYDGNLYGNGSSPVQYTFVGTEEDSYELISTNPGLRFNVIPLAFTKNPTTGALNGYPEPQTDLDSFSGFLGIQDIKFIDDLDTIVTKKDQMEFGKLSTEYEVLKENYQKNFVTKSRVTPYINKWVYNGGSDARGNEYRLNVHPAFTPFNFSPSFFSESRDPRYFTHEWYLLETPRIDSPDSLVKNSRNYCSNILDISKLVDSNPSGDDYFLRYFTVDGKDYENNLGRFETSSTNPIGERYTTFEYNSASGFSETLFRGVKVKIKPRTDAAIQTSAKGVFRANDKTFEGYRFSCIIKPIEDPNPYQPTPPITYKVYENRTHKTVTMVISIINSDSRFVDGNKFWEMINSSPFNQGSWDFNPTGIYGGLDYFALYSLDDKLRMEEVTAGPDYGSVISDIKLTSGINFSYSLGPLGITPLLNTSTVNGSGIIPVIRNDNYNTDLRDEISSFYLPSTPISGPGSPYDISGSPALTINGTNETGRFTFYSPRANVGGNWFTLPWPVGAGRDEIYFNQVDPVASTGTYRPNFTNLGYTPPIFAHAPVNVNYNALSALAVYQKDGGKDYWKNLLAKISFGDIALLVNAEDPYVKYYSYEWNSSTGTNVEIKESFVLEFNKPSAFIQDSNLFPIEDINKPQNLAKIIAGYNLATSRSTNEFYRYGGGYNPKFRDIIHFSDFKDDSIENQTVEIDVTLVPKSDGSLYQDIGSPYEISMDGFNRKRTRLVKGQKYLFNYVNFYSPGFAPGDEIEAELVISTLENDGTEDNWYLNGTTLSNDGQSMIFIVPYDVPGTLYYELEGSRYSGGTITMSENLSYKNTKIGVDKDDFGRMRNISFNKYAIINPFTIDPNSGFKPVYPLVGEAPFDIRDMSIFESTWDPGRFRNYLARNASELVPGTRLMKEERNFWGSKVMKTPGLITIQKQIPYGSNTPGVFLINPGLYPKTEIFWEETETQIMALLLVDRSLINYLDSSGAGRTFERLLLPDFGTGDKSTLADDITNYLTENVVPIFKANKISVFIKKVKKDPKIDLPPIVTNLDDHEKMRQGFYSLDQVNVIETDHLQYEFTFTKDPGFDYQVAFSYNIGKI